MHVVFVACLSPAFQIAIVLLFISHAIITAAKSMLFGTVIPLYILLH